MKKRKLSPGVARALDEFLLTTSFSFGGSINNETYEALYAFLQYTHAHNVLLGDDELRDILIEEGAQKEDAEEIASIYLNSRNLLFRKKPWDDRRMYEWLRSRNEKQKLIDEYKHNQHLHLSGEFGFSGADDPLRIVAVQLHQRPAGFAENKVLFHAEIREHVPNQGMNCAFGLNNP